VQRHYKNVYITLWQIYSKHYVPSFISISEVVQNTTIFDLLCLLEDVTYCHITRLSSLMR